MTLWKRKRKTTDALIASQQWSSSGNRNQKSLVLGYSLSLLLLPFQWQEQIVPSDPSNAGELVIAFLILSTPGLPIMYYWWEMRADRPPFQD
jgi:hypothetical protein